MSAQRTVLHLVNRLDEGGVLRHVTDLAEGLEPLGFRSILAAWAPPGNMLHDDARFIHLPLYGRTGQRKSATGFLAALRRLRQALAEQQVDVLHMHSRYALLIGRCVGTKAARVYTEHNLFEDGRALRLYPRHIIALSRAGARQLRAQFHDDMSRRITVIPHGIDIPAEAPLSVVDENAVFAWVGRIEQEKGLHDVLDAIASLRKKNAEEMRLEVVGDGSLRSAMERRCVEQGIADLVCFHGWLRRPFERLPQVRAMIFSSHALDAFPYVNLEAMARGIPVIASELAVLDELVVDEESGLRYSRADPETLEAALLRASGQPAPMRQLGVSARTLVMKHFTREGMLRRTAELYREILPP